VTTQTRIIPRLDIKGPNLVKGVHLEGLRVLGRPEAFARWYDESGADELIYLDVVASLYGRNNLFDIVRRTSSEVFIPLTVGGGLRTVDDVREALRAGADKVAINTAAVRNPGLVADAVRRFGSSTIVVSIEAIETSPGKYEAFTDHGREPTGVDAIEWALRAAELGAGELLLTSIDREGTGRGFDLRFTRAIADAVGVPVVASGGAGMADHVREALADGHADAVAVASIVHYHAVQVLPVLEGTREGNTEYLRAMRTPSKISPCPVGEVADHLAGAGFLTRATMSRHVGA
jgi:imidazole glycerol-phosphate synthase subunit HisF